MFVGKCGEVYQEVYNLTRNPVSVYAAVDVARERPIPYMYVPPERRSASVERGYADTGTAVIGVPVVTPRYGKVKNLPKHKKGLFYIVTRDVAEAAKASGRKTDDLLIPSGFVSGRCTGFEQI